MKVLIITMALSVASFAAHASNTLKYIGTENDTVYCQKIRVGLVKTKCTKLNGEKIKVNNKDVKIINKNGHQWVKLPVNKSLKNNDERFMELVAYINGVHIYRYEHYNALNGEIDMKYHIYRKNKHINTMVNPSKNEMMDFFAECRSSVENLVSKK